MVVTVAEFRPNLSPSPGHVDAMAYHDEVEIEDFEFDEAEEIYYYPCPCGDRFQISKEELAAGEEVATCPSCSLIIKVIYDPEKFQAELDEMTTDDEKKLCNAMKAL